MKSGDVVSYRALAGQIYPATVRVVHADGRLDVDVMLPGVKDAFGRSRVRWLEAESGERGVCFPRGTDGEKRNEGTG